jgi:hypothetical protein
MKTYLKAPDVLFLTVRYCVICRIQSTFQLLDLKFNEFILCIVLGSIFFSHRFKTILLAQIRKINFLISILSLSLEVAKVKKLIL